MGDIKPFQFKELQEMPTSEININQMLEYCCDEKIKA